MKKTILLAVLSALPATAAVAQMPPAAKGPSMEVALEAAKVAVNTCKANGYTVSVSVVDSAGVLKTLVANDGAFAMAVTSSQRKAVTAIAYGKPTSELEAKAKADTAFAAEVSGKPTLFARAGAQLLVKNGVVLGAIGVGGAPGGEKDDVCALAAVTSVANKL